MENENTDQEKQKAALLEQINSALEKLGSTTRWEKIPEGLEGNEILKDKIIVMVDDVIEVLEALAPALTVVTEGKANFVHYKGQELKQLLDEILAYNPNIILLDYSLSKQLKGPQVMEALRTAGFNGETIGFTSDEAAVNEFKDRGASGCVKKNAAWPEKSIKGLKDLIDKKGNDNNHK